MKSHWQFDVEVITAVGAFKAVATVNFVMSEKVQLKSLEWINSDLYADSRILIKLDSNLILEAIVSEDKTSPLLVNAEIAQESLGTWLDYFLKQYQLLQNRPEFRL